MSWLAVALLLASIPAPEPPKLPCDQIAFGMATEIVVADPNRIDAVWCEWAPRMVEAGCWEPAWVWERKIRARCEP